MVGEPLLSGEPDALIHGTFFCFSQVSVLKLFQAWVRLDQMDQEVRCMHLSLSRELKMRVPVK